MRLLMTTDAVGGVWQYATELAAGLPRHGVEVLLAAVGPAPGDEQRREVARLAGVRLLETGVPLDWLSDGAAVRRGADELARLARRERIDIVHLNSPALAAEGGFDVPVIAVAHGCVATWWDAARTERLDEGFRWHHDMTGRGLALADRVIAPSASFAHHVQRRYGLKRAPTVVLNGRTLPSARPAGAPRDAVFTAGRLWDAVKSTAALDAVAARLPIPFEAAGARAGPGGERATLDHLVPLGVLRGAELADRLAARPIFVSAATFEPFGLAVLEAAGAGCPLVLSDIATFRELWEGAALFVSATDVDGFVAAIDRCRSDPDLRRRLSAAARNRAATYTADRMVAAMRRHYHELSARPWAHGAAA